MSRRKKDTGHVSHERWLISYADFITLLFAFFVVMYDSSQTDRAKSVRLAAAIQAAFQQMGMFHPAASQPPLSSSAPLPYTSPQAIPALKQNSDLARLSSSPLGVLAAGREMRLLATELQKKLAPEISKHQVSVKIEKTGVVVSLQEAGFYPSGSAVLLPGSAPTLARIAAVLCLHQNGVRMEGHTDNVPIHNAHFQSNWDLSAARATGLVETFITRFDFPADRLSAASYAQYHPVASNATAAGRRLNRRVDVVILPPPGSYWAPPTEPASAGNAPVVPPLP